MCSNFQFLSVPFIVVCSDFMISLWLTIGSSIMISLYISKRMIVLSAFGFNKIGNKNMSNN